MITKEIMENLKTIVNKENYENWFEITKPILLSDEFQKRLKFKHHYKSVFHHCVLVSFLAYNLSLKFKCDSKVCAIAGLLHDFYPNPWQYSKELESMDPKYIENLNIRKSLFKKHGFTHAKEAYDNYHKYFPEYINYKIDDAIKCHMFPLNIKPPKYKESWIITLSDKIVATKELMKIC